MTLKLLTLTALLMLIGPLAALAGLHSAHQLIAQHALSPLHSLSARYVQLSLSRPLLSESSLSSPAFAPLAGGS
jgi:hypothetical protein